MGTNDKSQTREIPSLWLRRKLTNCSASVLGLSPKREVILSIQKKIELSKLCLHDCGKHIIQYSPFFHPHLRVPIYWSNRAENAPTAVALYCELVYTFHSLRGQTRASLYFCNCRSPRERRSNVKLSNYKLKMTGYAFSLGCCLRLGMEVGRRWRHQWGLAVAWVGESR